jgi:dTDP-glucose 4,6-dehydratase
VILITGGAGFIGSNFVLRWMHGESEPVTVLDNLSYAGNIRNLDAIAGDGRFAFVKADIGDRTSVQAALGKYQPRAIINFAAESHVDRSIEGPAQFIQTNVVGTFSLLEESKAYWSQLEDEKKTAFRFLHVSTDEVYGTLGPTDAPFTEENAYAPNSPYAASKAASDHLVRAYHHTYGLPTLTTNCSNNYGPYQFPEKLIPLMILNAIDGKPLPVYGDGQQVRDWLYVEDHCDAIRRVLAAGRVGETYNIGGRCEMANLEVVRMVCEILDRLQADTHTMPRSQLITYVQDRPGHDRRYAVNCDKIERELGWRPAQNFAAGLERTVRWYLDNPAWVDSVRSGEYRQWIAQNYAKRGGA